MLGLGSSELRLNVIKYVERICKYVGPRRVFGEAIRIVRTSWFLPPSVLKDTKLGNRLYVHGYQMTLPQGAERFS